MSGPIPCCGSDYHCEVLLLNLICICAGLTYKQWLFEDAEVMLQLPGSQSVQQNECK